MDGSKIPPSQQLAGSEQVALEGGDSSLAIGNLIKAAHFTELRTAVNAGRAGLGWDATTFTDTMSGGGPVNYRAVRRRPFTAGTNEAVIV
jgi:hypothetical protein